MARDLRPSIRKAARWYRSVDMRPPWSVTHLVAMALYLSPRPMTEREVLKWILANFKFYAKLGSEAISETISTCLPRDYPQHRDAIELDDFRTKFSDAFQRFELPLIITDIDPKQMQYAMTDGTARQCLDRCFGQRIDATRFDFFALPAEIRNTIYEMVWTYPKAGIVVSQLSGSTSLLSRSYDADIAFFPSHHSWTWPIKEILQPLLLSRQFYKEAKPLLLQCGSLSLRRT
jgi:hypothetical protein